MQLADMTVMVNVIHGMVGFDRPFSQLTKVADLFPEIEKRIVFAEALEQAFRIEFESEEISAWGTLQNVVDSVVNQLDARRQVDDELTQISPEKIEAMRVETIKKHMPMYGTDVGHGHVWKRPDGVRARCGGPTICKTCANDLAWVEAAKKGEDVPTVVEAEQPAAIAPVSDKFDDIASAIETGNATRLAELLPSQTMPGNFDHSSADCYAMAWHLICTGDIESAIRRHEKSWLMRVKFVDRVDYRRKTIDAAVSLARRVTGRPDAQFWNVEDTDKTCSASGAACDMVYMKRFDKFGCKYCGRDATPEEDKAYRELEPVAVAPINRIEHKDVEDFRTGNYTVRNALNQYQHIALKSAIYPGKGTPFGLMYTALGLAEAGEVQNKVKKGFRDDNWIEFHGAVSERGREVVFNPVKPERREQITKELRGLLWYIAATASELDITLHDIALGNLEELCGRTDRGTLSGDGDDR